MKLIFKNLHSRIWFIVSSVLIVIFTVVVILASTTFSTLASSLLGSEELIGRSDLRYFDTVATSKEEAYENGNLFNEKATEEGFVLLKNDNQALPFASDEMSVSVFGKNSVNLVYGGSGSGGGHSEGASTIYESLEAAGFTYNPVLKEFYDHDDSGDGRGDNPAIENSGTGMLATGETPYDLYSSDVKASYSDYSDAAIIVISRIGGEGFDLPRYSQDSHYLQLDDAEKDLITAVKAANFGKIIIVVNSNNVIELGDLEDDAAIDSIIQVGGPGYTGIMSLGRIFNGEVTPSGHTVDTWAESFNSAPSWYNFGNNLVTGDSDTPAGNQYLQDGEEESFYFVDYEEGIYVGYRYYETRAETELMADLTSTWFEDNVVYPFGYGLSYTDFSWTIENSGDLANLEISDATKDATIDIQVRVTNTGDYKGKDVVQLYATAPYYAGGIEKSHVVLVGYEKTPMLYPADEANDTDKPNSAVVTISVNPYYMASYDYNDANNNGFMGYELEAGSYFFKLQTDSHNMKDGINAIGVNIASDITYDVDPVTGNPVVNRFDDASLELDTVLSRNDWDGTWPVMKNTRDFADYDFLSSELLNDYSTNNPNTYSDIPAMGQEPTLKLIELRGLDYNDPKWEVLLSSLTFDEIKSLANNGAFRTVSLESISKPATIESDGPVGFTNFMSDVDIYGTVAYASQAVMGATWNKALLEEFGNSVGEEGIFGKETARSFTPYSGWYAPGINIHRSPFGGRNFEYFSEDAYLSGTLAAAEIKGASDKGVYAFMKHFALNEQETNRDDNGVLTWATEQSIRELYLRPFEIATKEGNAHGLMSSFNRIGTKWTGGDYRLLTEVLRGEWGFVGTVISDFNVSTYMNSKQMVYAGGDLNLTTTRPWISANESRPGDVAVLRQAAHNILYTVVNSNAMNGIELDTELRFAMPVWQSTMYYIYAGLFVGVAAWGYFAIKSALKKDQK